MNISLDQFRPIWWEIRENWSKICVFTYGSIDSIVLDRKSPFMMKIIIFWLISTNLVGYWRKLVKKFVFSDMLQLIRFFKIEKIHYDENEHFFQLILLERISRQRWSDLVSYDLNNSIIFWLMVDWTAASGALRLMINEVNWMIVFDWNSRSQGSLSRLEQDGADGEASLSKMDIVLSFTLEVLELNLIIHLLCWFILRGT